MQSPRPDSSSRNPDPRPALPRPALLPAPDIRHLAIAISLLLSAMQVWLNPIPNTDAFDYVRTAEIFLRDGVAAAYSWYPSATYSVLMGVLHQWTGLSLFAAAHVLNALFYALVVYAFISIAKEIRDTRRLVLLAAVTILIYPPLNEYRYFLIRDIGFLGFALMGLLFLLRYWKEQRLSHALLFCLATAVAALFRSEALAYLLAGPLVLLGHGELNWRQRVTALGRITALTAVTALSCALLLWLLNVNVLRILEQVFTVYRPFMTDSWMGLTQASSPLSVAVFGEYAANFSGEYILLFMAAGLSAVLVAELIIGFGWLPLLLIGFGLQRRIAEAHNNLLRPVFFHAFIAFLIMLGFLLLTRFMSTRYALLFCTLLVLLIPFIIDNLMQQREGERATRLFQGVMGFVLLFCTIDAHFTFGGTKHSFVDASRWLREHTAENATVLTNEAYVAYHSGRVRDYDRVLRYINTETVDYAGFGTYLALSVDDDIAEVLEATRAFQQIELMAAFPPEGEPEFVIYRRTGFLP